MTSDDFYQNIVDRYGEKANKPKIKEDIITNLDNYSDDMLEVGWERFTQNYMSTQAPMWSHIYTIFKQKGIYPKLKKSNGYNTCIKCKAKYSLKGRRCPKCGSKDRTVTIADKKPDGFIAMRELCHECTHYPNYGKDNRVAGVECKKYGTLKPENIEQGKGVFPYSYCSDCYCMKCCMQASITDYSKHKQLYEGISKDMIESKQFGIIPKMSDKLKSIINAPAVKPSEKLEEGHEEEIW